MLAVCAALVLRQINYDAGGARVQARRQLAPRVSANARASWEQRFYRETNRLNGPVSDLSLGATWTISPVLRANASIGYGRERPESVTRRNRSRRARVGLSAILPLGVNARISTEFRWADYEGSFNSFPSDGRLREDFTRTTSLSVFKRDFTIFGFAPQLVLTHAEQTSTTRVGTRPIYDYDRTRAEIRFVHQF